MADERRPFAAAANAATALSFFRASFSHYETRDQLVARLAKVDAALDKARRWT